METKKKKRMFNLKREFELLDSALAYWGDETLHFTLKDWYDQLRKSEMNKHLERGEVKNETSKKI
jgi:hypothetical protein